MTDFRVTLLFGIPLRFSRIEDARLTEVHWIPPQTRCIKANIDGSSLWITIFWAIGGVFRNRQSHFIERFAHNIGYATSFGAKLYAAMYAIEKSWWYEYDWYLYRYWLSNSREGF